MKAGNEVPLYETEFGKIGVMICYNCGFPELTRELMLKGAYYITPAAPLQYADKNDYINTVKIFIDKLGLDIKGIITNENGGTATVNGWLQSSALNIPLLKFLLKKL